MTRTLKHWNDTEAREALSKYDKTVRYLARRYRPRGGLRNVIDEEDLVAEGRIAVLEALERYESYGIKESTFVGTRVKQRMIDALRRVDVRTREENRLLRSHDAGETSGDEHRRARRVAARQMVSLDAPFGELGPMVNRMVDEAPIADDLTEEAQRYAHLETAMTSLPSRQRQALRLCLDEGLRLREIGQQMGISESRVCQLQKRAVEHLQTRMATAA